MEVELFTSKWKMRLIINHDYKNYTNTNKLSSKMEINFVLEEKVLLITKYIKLIRKKDFDKIVVKRGDIKSINLQFGEISKRDIVIRVSFKGLKTFKNDYYFNVLDILIKNREIILTGILDDPLWIYNQGYIDNFKLLTDKKEKIKWYELNDKQKYYYLRGCYFLGGLRKSIDNMNPIIEIDFSKVRTDLDVYYEIGKAFFNSYGYFGTEFHSFRDCLINIDESMRKREKMPVLKIKEFKNFEKYFSYNILFDDFYNEFKASGFEIENSK
ncbi:hypothetical protein OK18_14325 [Chryseobacterium gallinarum]|uniref:Barstar (barnase inhibitor) domain-containing protein n=1 Tax=Chryseobacterium gallinarum TaxID=1324352 RepID=A0A0G3M6L1_CHRGL|nr:hypothetical protein [Chryseobacterium gallinarum]AKK73618.1 hypothetical protein OK18_14325 [Chryseobacterium gallinarum]